MPTPRSEEELAAYLASPEFRRKAGAAKARILAAPNPAAAFTFAELAIELDVPEDVLIGGFQHAMAKAGVPVRPKLNG